MTGSGGGWLSRVRGAVAWRVSYARYRLGRVARRVRRSLTRVGERDVAAALANLGPLAAPCLFVHSSLSACGRMEGGPATVVRALMSWTEGRTLILPTHTYCYPDGTGAIPVYRADATPSRVGAITEFFWRQPGVIRSCHPTHSLAGIGPLAGEITAGHESCSTPCGSGTPYARLVSLHSGVLMFGARLDAYTLFHTAEDAAGVPYLYEPEPYDLRVAGPDGTLRIVRMWRQDAAVPRRFAAVDRWLEGEGLLRRARLGLGELLFIPDAAAVQGAVIGALRRDPFFLVAGSARADVASRCAHTERCGPLPPRPDPR